MKAYLTVVAIIGIVILPAAAGAGILGTTGAIQLIAPPADVTPGQLESNTAMFAFAERNDVNLATGIGVDISLPGTSPLPSDPSNANLSPATLLAGTEVDSYYVHFDPVGVPPFAVRRSGSITFDSDILGIILLHDTLLASNAILGAPGTLYDGQQVDLTIDDDVVTLSADRRTITLDLATGPSADNLRIVTTAVPEPAAAALLLVGSAAFSWTLLRRNRRQCNKRCDVLFRKV